MSNEPWLDAVARRTAVEIVDRHARDSPNRAALIEAIFRLARCGLEGHARLYEAQHRQPSDD
jgi:hypothetical protein